MLLAAAMLISACATPLTPHPQPQSFSIAPDPVSPAWEPLRRHLPTDETTSWFDIQDIGPDALRWRLALIDTATTSLDAQYFIWKDDAVGSLLLKRLLQAADRGVRVRLLLDDSFLSGEDAVLLAADAHPNVNVRIFNPFQVRADNMLVRYIENLNDQARINHRMHNKLLISDSQAAIVGGRNIADEYFGFNRNQNFRDFDVLVTGEVMPQITASFDSYWNSDWAFPVAMVDGKKGTEDELIELRAKLRANAAALHSWLPDNDAEPRSWSTEWAALAPTMLPGKATIHQDKPRIDDQTPPVQAANRVLAVFKQTRADVVSISAYLIPSEPILRTARDLSNRGVKIRALTNSLASNNHVAAHTAYRHRREHIVKAGVDLYELRPHAPERSRFEAPGFTAEHIGLHAKILVLDRRLVFVGTLNTDPRSMVLNTEVSIMIDSPQLAEAILGAFAVDFSPQNSWRVELGDDDTLTWHSEDGVLTRQPAGSSWRRVADMFYGLMPIDEQM
jgi:putative cardiolipin synthase